MIIKFSEVGINEKFTFVSQYPALCISGIKISPRKYAMDNGTVCTIGDSKFPCDVDNTCTCDKPRPLTFNDLSIGSIFQFGFVYRLWEKQTVLYIKLDNVRYRRLSASIPAQISDVNCTVCTVYNMQVAQ